MTAKILPLKRKKWVPLKDTKGRRVPNYLIHADTGIIYYRESFKKLGIPPLFISTGETTMGRAKTTADIAVQRHKNKCLGIDDTRAYGRAKSIPFERVAQEVLKNHTPTMRKGTQANHNIYIPLLIAEFGYRDINSISTTDFTDYIKRLRKTMARKTFMDYAKNMNLIMRYAYVEKYATHLITFKNPDSAGKTTFRVYTEAEIGALWGVMNEDTRDQFTLCYECMMRLREMLYLTWDRVNLKTGVITLRACDVKTGSKTGKGREFKASEGALRRLRARHAKRDKNSPYVFPSPTDPLKPKKSMAR